MTRDPFEPPEASVTIAPPSRDRGGSVVGSLVCGFTSVITPFLIEPIVRAFGIDSLIVRGIASVGLMSALAGVLLGYRGVSSCWFLVSIAGMVLSALGLFLSFILALILLNGPK